MDGLGESFIKAHFVLAFLISEDVKGCPKVTNLPSLLDKRPLW
jgi:hypothetical protein